MSDAIGNNLAGTRGPDAPFHTRLFTARLLSHESPPSSAASTADGVPSAATTAERRRRPDTANFWHLFPASFHTGEYRENITSVNMKSLSDFLKSEFSLDRIDAIYPKLWRVGYPRAANSLSSQALRGRTIVCTNSLDMHLVWDDARIFVKPLPQYLLEPGVWAKHLPNRGEIISEKPPSLPGNGTSLIEANGPDGNRAAALGLLYSYACLVPDQVDFELALREGLLPRDIDQSGWAEWRKLSAELLRPEVTGQMHRRFRYGELRLDRLNWIYIFKDIPRFQLYYNPWNRYTDVVISNVTWITGITVYLVVVLTAMQVGLATDALKDSKAFNDVSYGFAVVSIVTPVFALVLGMMALLVVVIRNWKTARAAIAAPGPDDTMFLQATQGSVTV